MPTSNPNGSIPTPEMPRIVAANPNGSTGNIATPTIGNAVFDPARWKTPIDARLDPTATAKPQSLVKIEVRKPPADHFVHAHPDPAFNAVFPLYSDSLAKRFDPFLIAPELTLPPQAQVNVRPTRLALAITDSGRVFLWHVAQTGSDWHESGDSAILVAMTRWVKVIPESSGYRVEYPQVNLPDPSFPDRSFEEYLRQTFGGEPNRYIASLDDPVIKRLAGIR